jgi:hypothetical protein
LGLPEVACLVVAMLLAEEGLIQEVVLVVGQVEAVLPVVPV